ncbi:MAG: hypothetical protein HY514_02295 [Candidatus Aenigmarchaeota archaeon]|nr:hypothetical protein [Candidatus Aenigmarchaeota archaeon]
MSIIIKKTRYFEELPKYLKDQAEKYLLGRQFQDVRAAVMQKDKSGHPFLDFYPKENSQWTVIAAQFYDAYSPVRRNVPALIAEPCSMKDPAPDSR